MIKLIFAVGICAALGMLYPAYAVDSMSVEEGEGSQSSISKLALQQSWGGDVEYFKEHGIAPYLEADVAALRSKKCDDMPGRSQTVDSLGVTPVFRGYVSNEHSMFLEIGIGANYMSQRFSANTRIMGSQFQFGDHVGIGYSFKNGWELSYKFQHYSNAGIHEPNPAINFSIIKIAYSFKS